jgi:quercetin dioxygenase-like cupin family protein
MANYVTLTTLIGVALAIVGCAAVSDSAAGGRAEPLQSSAVHELMASDLSGLPTRELRMLTVEYIAGGASLPHRHNAQVFVYVLNGSVRMQVEGSPVVLLNPGQTFYEGPDDIHTVSANASATQPARILVFMVKEKGAAVSGAAVSEERP